MKRITQYIIGTLLLCSSCAKLDQAPHSFLTPENLEYDEQGIQTMANGLYTALWMGNWDFSCRQVILMLGSDDMICGTITKRGTQVDILNKDAGLLKDDIKSLWLNMYKVIQLSNMMLTEIPKSTQATQEVKNKYLGEAYFMRGYAYFMLVRMFGDVPAIIDYNAATDIFGNKKIPRTRVADIYDKLIVNDLQQAEALLPDIPRSNNNSRPCKWAAKTILADVYITMAGWPLKRTEMYTKAAEKAKEVIDGHKYRLMDNYSDLWLLSRMSDMTEHIFALNHSVTQGTGGQYGISYLAAEETGWGDYLGDSLFYEKYPNDKRKEWNYVTTFTGNGVTINFKQTPLHAPAIGKYRNWGTKSSIVDGITPICRYADALLLYAEAQNKADGAPNSLSYDCVNQIRKRGNGGVANDLQPGLSADSFTKAVADERGWEFFAEFRRWHELVRTQQVEAVNRLTVTQKTKNQYLMPVPVDELTVTGWQQNPGY
ncbi:SusD-like starch-binding protein associating with outer membrane [Chitinophaga dinghuensis]|uniref:SusD-like starch-binding protein associating with outer membrane n=1 Tax=Chitinophaga dinghuensis TaxID=1539050 RepID=A0A327VRV4_9BACT|nr:RagB/SusD family nutrient uptake outer membrane protein [Chitinophaga dinghuensis]RAJ72795.1 SusD-like starch-binding protein associating with outer membrane [Chitinophaga dinghuensis]